jgi:hypothetical protein
MPFWPSLIAKLYWITVAAALLCPANFGLTLEDLRGKDTLTPAEFAHYFRDFRFVFRKEVQRPEVFLAAKAGDCDDFSTLAAAVLREKGYTPRLISVRMPGVTHVVCYIEETKSYLDYNNRSKRDFFVSSGGSLHEIAGKVARSYGLNWTSASEFTYEHREKRLVKSVFERPERPNILASVFR